MSPRHLPNQSLFENHHSVMLVIDPDTRQIVDANPAAEAFYGWTKAELTQKKITDINMLTPGVVHNEITNARQQRQNHFIFRHQLASGEIRDVEVYSAPIRQGDRELLYSIVHDITDQTQVNRSLLYSQQMLEATVQQRNAELEETNTALRILLKHREADKNQLVQNLESRYETLVLPLLAQLKTSLVTQRQDTLMELLESSLTELFEPFSVHLEPLRSLTPAEMQVAAMVKQGMTNKEIAQITHKSVRTVSNHRDHIRQKLGIRNRKINLRVHLNTLK